VAVVNDAEPLNPVRGATNLVKDVAKVVVERRREVLTGASLAVAGACIYVTAGICAVGVGVVGTGTVAQSVQDNAGQCNTEIAVDAALSFGPWKAGRLAGSAIGDAIPGVEKLVGTFLLAPSTSLSQVPICSD
jgi:hypothetical protein